MTGHCPYCYSTFIGEIGWVQQIAYIEKFNDDKSIEFSGDTVTTENHTYMPDDPNYHCGACGKDFNNPLFNVDKKGIAKHGLESVTQPR